MNDSNANKAQPNFLLIPLRGKHSKGDFAKVDLEDYKYLNQYKWFLAPSGYAVRIVYSDNRSKTIYMHREVMQTPKGTKTDHINRDKIDNRRGNLRLCNQSQNLGNQIGRGKLSSYKGVFPKGNTFRASIKFERKDFYLGYYPEEVTAAKAYDKAARFLFGPFALTNFHGSEAESPESIANKATETNIAKQRSRYKGVDLFEGKWRTRLMVGGQRITMLGFANEEEAARAYDDARAARGLSRVNF